MVGTLTGPLSISAGAELDEFRYSIGGSLTARARTILVLRYPHLVFFIPGVIRSPYLQADGVFAAGLGYENPFGRVRDLGPGDNHDFFGDALVDEDAITLAHGHSILSSSPLVHGAKLSPRNSTGKLFAALG